MYLSQSAWVEVDWSGVKLNFIPFHSNTYGLNMHPNKALSGTGIKVTSGAVTQV